MDKICVVGGKPLTGELYVKNAKMRYSQCWERCCFAGNR